MDNLINVDTIIDWLTKQVEEKQPIDTETWLYAASRINVLLQGEQEKLFTLEQEVANVKRTLIEQGKTVAYAKVMVEATDKYKDTKIQKAKIDRCLEMIRLAKLQARMARDLMDNQMQ